MSFEALAGTYSRLRRELAEAYLAPRWNEGRIDRIADEILRVERAMSSKQPIDEQTNDALPSIN